MGKVVDELKELRSQTTDLVVLAEQNSEITGDILRELIDFDSSLSRALYDASSQTQAALENFADRLSDIRADLHSSLELHARAIVYSAERHSQALEKHASAIEGLGTDYVAGQAIRGVFGLLGSAVLGSLFVAGMDVATRNLADSKAKEKKENSQSSDEKASDNESK